MISVHLYILYLPLRAGCRPQLKRTALISLARNMHSFDNNIRRYRLKPQAKRDESKPVEKPK
jgi:hypothetical protein